MTAPSAKMAGLRAAIAEAGCDVKLKKQLNKPCGKAYNQLGFVLESSAPPGAAAFLNQ